VEAAPLEPPGAALPPLWKRVLDVFVAPGDLFAALAREPRWFAAVVVGGVLMGGASWVVPVEVYQDSMRAAALERGGAVPDNLEQIAGFSRLGATIFGPVLYLFMSALLAGFATLMFAFVFGDRGRFKQYLSAATHVSLISAVGQLVSTPLRISSGSPELGISVGSALAGFLPEGYLLNVLMTQQLFGIWATFAFAIAATRIEPKRGLGSAFAILMALSVGLGMIGALFM